MEKTKEKLHKQFAIQRNFQSIWNILSKNIDLIEDPYFQGSLREARDRIKELERIYK